MVGNQQEEICFFFDILRSLLSWNLVESKGMAVIHMDGGGLSERGVIGYPLRKTTTFCETKILDLSSQMVRGI